MNATAFNEDLVPVDCDNFSSLIPWQVLDPDVLHDHHSIDSSQSLPIFMPGFQA